MKINSNKLFFFFYYFLKIYVSSFIREKNYFFSDKKFKNYWSIFLKNLFKRKENKKEVNILLDSFDIPNWYISNYLFIACLKKTYKVNLFTFGLKKSSKEKEIIDKEIGVNKHFQIKPRIKDFKEIKKIFLQLVKKVKTRKDLINFKYKGLDFGLDIYESILREGFKTIDFNNKITYKNYLIFALYYINFIKILKNKFHFVLLSHDNYINYNVPAKLSREKKVNLFLINSKEIIKSKKTFTQFEIFKRYKKELFTLKKKEYFNKLKTEAKRNLSKRISGDLNVDMDYQKLSAFHNKKIKNQIKYKSNYNILIATHCFYDNPHAFAKLEYLDFWDWMIYLGNLSKESPKNFSWYIKPHRDFLPGTIEILRSFVKKFPNIKILDTDVSFKQLASEGLDLILTCHGSIAHEAPLLGIDVINCAYNNSIKFNFSKTILNKKTLRKTILNIKKKKNRISEDIYDFYVIHYFHYGRNKFWKEFTNSNSNKSISYLKNFKDFKKNEDKICLKVNKFLNSKINNSKEMF